MRRGDYQNPTHQQASRKITADQVRYALARRPATSWQNLARQLNVNAEDLRHACEMGGAS